MPVAASKRIEKDAVPWNDIVRFVRQLSHDLRNYLNGIELHAALLAELADTAEVKDEVKRLRETVSDLAGALQKLTTTLLPASPHLIPYRAADFIQDLRDRTVSALPKDNASIQWNGTLKEEKLQIDPELIQQAILEIFSNAFLHGRSAGNLQSIASADGDKFRLEVHEPKENFALPTENWGGAPFSSVGRARYGLGLHRARTIIESHQGQLKARYDVPTSTLVTTITLPLLKEGSPSA